VFVIDMVRCSCCLRRIVLAMLYTIRRCFLLETTGGILTSSSNLWQGNEGVRVQMVRHVCKIQMPMKTLQ
jgi:hypothetical protein